MRKNDDHGPYCGCLTCKPLDVTDPSTEDTGDWPLIKPEPDTRPKPDA